MPTAKRKKVVNLKPQERTLNYERCRFIYRLTELSKAINGQEMDLSITSSGRPVLLCPTKLGEVDGTEKVS